MKVHEYQAKNIFKTYGIPVPKGAVTGNSESIKEILDEIGDKSVIKAQVLAGGRGKAGGVKIVSDINQADKEAKNMLGKKLVTHQTGKEGVKINKILIEEAIDIKKEYYVGIVLDREKEKYTFMVSPFGGMEIEEVAEKHPEAIYRVYIDKLEMFPFQARKLAFDLGLKGKSLKQAVKIFLSIFKLHVDKDASLTEINPMILDSEDNLLALDAKVNFDDNALYKHKKIAELRDLSEEDELEVRAKKHGISYIKLDGSVGCMVNGAGLAMATMDIIKYYGEMPANFLDVGGGASVDTVKNAFNILLSDEKVKVVLINIFGGIVRCDRIAEGVVKAAEDIGVEIPIVIRLVGTNQEEGQEILKKAPFSFFTFDTMNKAAEKAVQLTKGGE